MKTCEACGKGPEPIKSGPFAGDTSGLMPYCAFCSRDLCEKCLASTSCRVAADRKHRQEVDCEKCYALIEQTGVDAFDPNCPDCKGTGTALR